MFKSMFSNDPTELELHIQRSIASFKDGAKLSALYGIGIFLLGAFGGAMAQMVLPAIGLSLFVMPGCQFWSIFLRRGIHLPKFTFWGRIEFVVMGYVLQFMAWVIVYVGTPLLFLAAITAIASAVSPILALIVSIAFLLWPLTMFGYIAVQRHRLRKLISNSDDAQVEPEKGAQELLALQ